MDATTKSIIGLVALPYPWFYLLQTPDPGDEYAVGNVMLKAIPARNSDAIPTRISPICSNSKESVSPMLSEQLFPATAMPDPDWWHALWPQPDKIISALQIKPHMQVIDLGCGDGYFTAAIARQLDSGHVVGFDLDPLMLARAQAACADLAHCSWLHGDAMALNQLIPTPVDYVLIANTFHGVPAQTALAAEIAASLQAEGCFAIINWYPLPREYTTVLALPRGPRTELRMSVAQTQRVVEPAGFELEQLVEFPPYHYGAIFRKSA